MSGYILKNPAGQFKTLNEMLVIFFCDFDAMVGAVQWAKELGLEPSQIDIISQ
jgi:hypothetical protein